MTDRTVSSRTFRKAAYRNYILDTHGYLGKRKRKVVPSCCVLCIRRHYPSATGIYMGFRQQWNVPGEKTTGAFHLLKISGSAVNGTRFVGSSHWKIPRKSGKSKKEVPFSRLEFPNGMWCSIYVSCSLYQFQVHGRAPGHVPGFTTKWNNFLPIGNSTFATTEISGFFS